METIKTILWGIKKYAKGHPFIACSILFFVLLIVLDFGFEVKAILIALWLVVAAVYGIVYLVKKKRDRSGTNQGVSESTQVQTTSQERMESSYLVYEKEKVANGSGLFASAKAGKAAYENAKSNAKRIGSIAKQQYEITKQQKEMEERENGEKGE